MNIKLLPIILISFLVISSVYAQQRPQYSLYMMNNYLLNPAITGIEDYADVKVGYRNQWQGIEGAPVTSYFSIQSPIGNANNLANPEWQKSKRPTFYQYRSKHKSYKKVKPHHGIGAIMMMDKIGPFQQFEAHFTYAYHILLNDKIKLSQGLSAGFNHYSLNTTNISLGNSIDNAVANKNFNQLRSDIFAGMWLYSDDFYVGVSGAQLLGNLISTEDINMGVMPLKPHYFLTGGYTITPIPELAIIPSVMIKLLRPVPASIDFNVRGVYLNRMWTGISYRHRESVVLISGFSVNPRMDISYAFDTSISGIGAYGNGSHELLLGFRLRNRHKVYCPQNMW